MWKSSSSSSYRHGAWRSGRCNASGSWPGHAEERRVGQRRAEHAVEMGFDPEAEPPFFFSKPAGSVVPDGSALEFPKATDDLHHEVELVVALGRDAPLFERYAPERGLIRAMREH